MYTFLFLGELSHSVVVEVSFLYVKKDGFELSS